MLFLLALLSLVPAAQLCWELSKQLVGVALNPRFLQVDQEGISQKASQDVRIGRRGFLSRLQQELCRDSGVLFKSTFLMSSKSARTLAPVQTSSAMGIKSRRELHQWDSPCPAWSQSSEGAAGASAGAAGRSSTNSAEQKIQQTTQTCSFPVKENQKKRL